ncbi:hypothetical protein BDR03DRAFT_561131 [Suillus americanus]|nr:hypothetical protein BDR03DRAFT_561131 [Suillus americanus]
MLFTTLPCSRHAGTQSRIHRSNVDHARRVRCFVPTTLGGAVHVNEGYVSVGIWNQSFDIADLLIFMVISCVTNLCTSLFKMGMVK